MRKASLSSILPRSVGKPSVMFLRLPPKKLTSTRLPGMVPGTSLKTKQAAVSSCKASSDTMPISCCHDRPLTSLTSPSLRASSSHWRRSSYGRYGTMLEPATFPEALSGVSNAALLAVAMNMKVPVMPSFGVSSSLLHIQRQSSTLDIFLDVVGHLLARSVLDCFELQRFLVCKAPTVVDEHDTHRLETIKLHIRVRLLHARCAARQPFHAWVTRLEQQSCTYAS